MVPTASLLIVMALGPELDAQLTIGRPIIVTTRPPDRRTQANLARLMGPLIKAECRRHGLPVLAGYVLVGLESGWAVGARSRMGAIGLTQLMPETAAELGVSAWDPEDNIRGGIRYLAAQYRRFGRLDLAFAAYNAGPGLVARLGRVPRIKETQAYVKRAQAMLAARDYYR